MSGICGIVNFDGKPIDTEILENMAKCISYRGPDGINYWIEGNVGLVHLALNTTPESFFESQPLLNKEENLIMVADARVDNRDELITSLKSQGYLGGNKHTDADLILAAYEYWGENCPKHIIGDFAFAIWDKENEKLFIARDVVGIRQLFYSKHENSLYFASAVQPIAHALPKLPSLNTQLMQDFLRRFYELWVCQTIYNDILRLPPAHSLTVTEGLISRNLYYVFGQQKKPNYSSDEEWEAAFLELFDEVLQNQLRSITPVGMWVSGGLDSSALACQAYDLKKKYQDLPEIRLYSGVFDESTSINESDYFESVANYCDGIKVKSIKSDNYWAFCELGKDNGFPLDEPDLWELRGYSRMLMKKTKEDGCGVYITGLGSDDLIGLSFYFYPVSLRDVEFRNWSKELHFFKEKNGFNILKLLLYVYLVPLIPKSILHKIHLLLNKNELNSIWLNSNYKPSNPLECNLNKYFMTPGGLSKYGLIAYQMMRIPWFIASLDMFGLMTADVGIELRQPYFDRRMIEFLIAIPSHLRSFNGLDRILLRESMKGRMPEVIRTRKDKASTKELYQNGFYEERERIMALIQNSRLERMGLINSEKLINEFEALLSGNFKNFKYLSWFISLETWLREQDDV